MEVMSGSTPDDSSFMAVGAEEGTSCTLCNARFTATFRRHHCRQCEKLVCDDCSKHRLRLPQHPQAGKVRVCNPCALALGENRASFFEEDLQENSKIIAQLKCELVSRRGQYEASKRVLLELEAEAAGDPGLVERYEQDKESDAHSFGNLRDMAQQRWAALLQSLEAQGQLRAELQERHRQSVEKRDKAASARKALADRHDVLEGELAAVTECEAKRDELKREEEELERLVEAARRRVRDLEAERREQQERQAQQQQSRWGTGRLSYPLGSMNGTSSPRQSPLQSPQPEVHAFTISTGRQDPLLGQGGRLECLRRTECLRQSCSLM